MIHSQFPIVLPKWGHNRYHIITEWLFYLLFLFYASKGMTMHCIWELPILLPETFKVLSNCTIWISAPARYYIGASKRHCLNSQNEDWVQFFFFLFLSIYQKYQQIKRQIYSANSLIDQNHTVADFGHCCCTVETYWAGSFKQECNQYCLNMLWQH